MIDLSDPISRQQAITALRALSDEDGYINAPHEVVTDVVRGLPPVKAKQGQNAPPEQGKTDELASKMGRTWADVTCPNCGCEIHLDGTDINVGGTIYRQDAIDFVGGMEMCDEISAEAYKKLTNYFEDMPSAQPKIIACGKSELVQDGLRLVQDCIDRQAAIDAMADTIWHYPNECYRNLNSYEFSKALAELGLKSVPSAQPEPLSDVYTKAVWTWLLDYQIKAAELKGKYTPYEVLSWVANDWRKEHE